MNLKTIGVLMSLVVVAATFQNCSPSSKDGGAADGQMAAFQSLDSHGQLQTAALGSGATSSDLSLQASNVVGNYDVVAVTHSTVVAGSHITFKEPMKSQQTLNLLANRTLSGKSACNSYGGTYKLSLRPNEGTHLISVNLGAKSEASCALAHEEGLLFVVLSEAYKISNTSSATVDIYASGAKETNTSFILHLKRRGVVNPPPVKSSLSGNYRVIALSQKVCKTNYISGEVCVYESVRYKSKQTVSFLAKNVLSGKAACNSFGGSYKYTVRAAETVDLLSITNLVATRMACDNIAEEQQLLNALGAVYKVAYSRNNNVQSAHLYLSTGATLLLQK